MATNALFTLRLTLTLTLALTSTFLRDVAGVTHALRRGQRLTAATPLTSVTFPQSTEHFGRCVSACLQNPDCCSVNVRWNSATSSVTCEFLGVCLHEVNGVLTSDTGWVFIQEEPVYVLGQPWALAFRVTAGNAVNAFDTWNQVGRHDDADRLKSCLLPAATYPTCQSHFRSFIMDHWTKIDQVRITLHKNDTIVADLTFDGADTTSTSWLTKSRLETSSWSDLTPSTSTNYFSVEGIDSVYRRFYLSNFHAGCSGDEGWLVVTDYTPGGNPVYGQCPFDYAYPLPAVLYSPLDGGAVWHTEKSSADVMLVSVKFAG